MANTILTTILAELSPKSVTLVAVSKTKPQAAISEMYLEGQRIFGENRVQELVEKHEALPKDIQWHLIGHLQRNKVKYIVPFVSMIHSIDSPRLFKEINKEAAKSERIIDCLLQFHIAEEESKFGFDKAEVIAFLESDVYKSAQNVNIVGIMGMATFTSNEQQVRKEFQHLKRIFEDLKTTCFQDKSDFKEISMGMSGDYQLAIEEGSTMVRIGSKLFGSRV
jgi:pyridoxal phosphate enzyme (YggS family)